MLFRGALQRSAIIGGKNMELRTTVQNFVTEITAHHISSDTWIRVIIDEPQIRRESVSAEILAIPSITRTEQRQRLNGLPHDYDPHASDELIAIIDASHLNTDVPEL